MFHNVVKKLSPNVSRVCEVAEKGAEYFLLPKTNLVKKDILLPENQQFRHKRCYKQSCNYLLLTVLNSDKTLFPDSNNSIHSDELFSKFSIFSIPK